MKITELGQKIFEGSDKPNIPLLSENARIIEAETRELRKLIKQIQNEAVPSGTVVAYSKPVIPDGWAICDGRNGTPNLVDRFIRGTGDAERLKYVGGDDRVVLKEENLPKHSHGSGTLITEEKGEHIHSIDNLGTNRTGSHNHSVTEMQSGNAWSSGEGITLFGVKETRTGSSGTHEHDITGSLGTDGKHTHTINGQTANTGDGEPINALPPYLRLFYIMKL